MAKKKSPMKGRSARKAKGTTSRKARKPAPRAKAKAKAKVKLTNLERLLEAEAIDSDAAKALNGSAQTAIAKLTKPEIEALIKAHLKVSPKKRWQPDPDGSIF